MDENKGKLKTTYDTAFRNMLHYAIDKAHKENSMKEVILFSLAAGKNVAGALAIMDSKEALEEYLDEYTSVLRKDALEKWGMVHDLISSFNGDKKETAKEN